MFDRHFFSSQLGKAALLSVAAMATFNLYALNLQVAAAENPAVPAARAAINLPLVTLA